VTTVGEVSGLMTDWKTFIALVLVFGAAPGLFIRLLVKLYPKSHPRRAELVAELYSVRRWEQPFWVAETGVVCLFEGPAARRAQKKTKSGSKPTRVSVKPLRPSLSWEAARTGRWAAFAAPQERRKNRTAREPAASAESRSIGRPSRFGGHH